ncbi:hypothetical protein D9615_003749 [Tricholomella constricta]|uniref:Peptidase A1 domain-containing protein n=1 Tax=Tricholomella constricta TaxID=117010 RepID=A0A8H5M6Y3_9AGAR|nr:hypothetical protein D9615_003749 [Tricholomella constricta]
MLSSFPLSLVLLLSVSHSVIAAPNAPQGQYVPLVRRTLRARSVEEWGEWAKAHREKLSAKYGDTEKRKRSTGTNLLTNQNSDSSFFGSLAIGTPPVSYNVILDTGSADLWVADANCNVTCNGVATFNPTASSTFSTTDLPFEISYGSGRASGTLGADTIQMAGFSVSNQTFGICDSVSDGLLTVPVSGLLGLAFKTIASSGATPFWQALVAGDAWDSPLMAFQLTRFLDDQTAQSLEFGGSFTMGFVNNTLFTGDIEYVDLATTASYWILPLTSLTTQGTNLEVPTGPEAYAAIDTGTTLVGGPTRYMTEFYAQIPGAAPGTGNFEGYYTYPCATDVNVTMAFGGKNWAISEADFRLTQLTQNQCLGAFFDLQTGRSAPSWIVGDTFLKNVYSVFRYDPPSVGFAQLSDAALALNSANTPVPSATIGSVAATVAATSTGQPTAGNSAAPSRLAHPFMMSLVAVWAVSSMAGLVLLL